MYLNILFHHTRHIRYYKLWLNIHITLDQLCLPQLCSSLLGTSQMVTCCVKSMTNLIKTGVVMTMACTVAWYLDDEGEDGPDPLGSSSSEEATESRYGRSRRLKDRFRCAGYRKMLAAELMAAENDRHSTSLLADHIHHSCSLAAVQALLIPRLAP